MHQVIPGEIFRQSLQQASCFFFDTWCAHAMNIVADSRNGQSVPKLKLRRAQRLIRLRLRAKFMLLEPL